MSIEKTKIIVASNHHRRAPHFEQSMQRLSDAGWTRVIVQNTGAGDFSRYHGPGSQFGSGPIPYDTAMQRLKQRLSGERCEVIALIDNDCFLSDTKAFEAYLDEFDRGSFDFVCHGVNAPSAAKYFTPETDPAQTIVHVSPMTFPSSSDIYGFYPEPHFENGYLLMRKSVFDKLSVEDFRNSRQMIRAFYEAGAKMGMHRASYVGSHSHYGDGWFHVGALFGIYHHVEARNFSAVKPDSEFDKARIGYFAAIERDTEVSFPREFGEALVGFYEWCGGKAAALEAWDRLTKGTCMEDWKPNVAKIY